MRLLLFLSLFTCFHAYGQKDKFLSDSGILTKKTWNIRDSSIINQLNDVAADSAYVNVKKGEKYARIAYSISRKIEFGKGEVQSLHNLVKCKIYQNDYDSAMVLANRSLTLSKRLNNPKLLVKSYESVGSVFDYQGKYDQAVDNYLKAVNVAKEHSASLAARSYHNIGLIYKKLDNPKKALEYQKKCEVLSRKHNDKLTLTSCLNNLGILKKNEQKYDEALAYYEEGLSLAEEIDNVKLQSDILSNMSVVFFEQDDPEKGMRIFERSLEWSRKANSYYELAMSYHNLAYNFVSLEKLDKASVAIDTAIEYAFLSGNFAFIVESFVILAEIEYRRGNHRAAYGAMTYAYTYKDSMNLVSLSDKVIGLENTFEKKRVAISDSLEKVQLISEGERDQQLSNEKLWFRDILLIVSFLILVLVAIGAFLLFKSNRKVTAKNKIVEEQHKEITDSINYAQRIQSAMISNDEAWQQISPHRSIVFKPKDVVSGDFYWAHFNTEKNLAIWCVADCTGHGVPGAFMSVLGSSFLTDIVVDGGETDPATILNLLRKKVISALTKKGENQPKDGMDIALCVWEKDTNMLHFSGANNPLYLIRRRENLGEHKFKRFIDVSEKNHVLLEVPPNKMPIGSYAGNEAPFNSTRLELHLGDTLILSSDGYADQFGGEQSKKMKSRPFKEFLLEIQNESMIDQSTIIEEHFESWKGANEQLDDVCVVGIRIS